MLHAAIHQNAYGQENRQLSRGGNHSEGLLDTNIMSDSHEHHDSRLSHFLQCSLKDELFSRARTLKTISLSWYLQIAVPSRKITSNGNMCSSFHLSIMTDTFPQRPLNPDKNSEPDTAAVAHAAVTMDQPHPALFGVGLGLGSSTHPHGSCTLSTRVSQKSLPAKSPVKALSWNPKQFTVSPSSVVKSLPELVITRPAPHSEQPLGHGSCEYKYPKAKAPIRGMEQSLPSTPRSVLVQSKAWHSLPVSGL